MKSLIIISSVFVLFLSCKKDKSNEVIEDVITPGVLTYCDTVTVSFSSQIQPIFIQSCATSGCHNDAVSASGYTLETHSQISDANTIDRVLKTIKHESGASPMPKFQQKLNDSLIQQIECWISQGKLNN